MKNLEEPFIKNGFYIIVGRWHLTVGDLVFIIGEPVGVMWIRGLCYISKTGEESGGNANPLDRKYSFNLRRLDSEEVSEFTGGRVKQDEAFKSVHSFVEACKLFQDKKKLV